MRRKIDVPWDKVKKEYAEGRTSKGALAEKYGIHVNTLSRKAAADGWVRQEFRQVATTNDVAPAVDLGSRCDSNVTFILDKIKSGWSPQRAFGACGFSKAQMEEWLKEDSEFLALTAAARQATLGIAEEMIWKSAAKRGVYDAAIKFLTNAPETKDQYTSDRASGGPKVTINVQIGNQEWDRDKPPIIINGDTDGGS